ncbi:MAG: hypothetical protein ACP5RM_02890 [Candidatus Micrarchaeia archaeon]
MGKNAIITLIVILSVLSLYFALSGSIYYAIAFFAPSAVLYARVRPKASGSDQDVLSFVNNMIANYSESSGLARCALKSLDKRMWFYEDMKKFLHEYMVSGSIPGKFPKEGHYGELLTIISMGLDDGAGIREALLLLSKDMEAEQEIRSRYSGSAYNALFISSMGSVVFFPIFAGISYYIMGFPSGIASAHQIGIIEYSFIIMFFVLETLLYRAIHSRRILSSIPGIAFSMSLAGLLFKASYLLSVGALRW